MKIRRLTPDDVEAFRELRARALLEHPEAFGESYEGFMARPLSQLRETFAKGSNDLFALGAFEPDLLGFLMFVRPPLERSKTRHRAHIASMYVIPEARRKGTAKALLVKLIEQAKEFEGLEHLVLAVSKGNLAAAKLYEAVGFRKYATDPKLIKVEHSFFDVNWMILEF